MKKILFVLICFQLFFISLVAQTGTLPTVDKSPMDMSYYPDLYPVLKIQDKMTEPLVARIIYSRPPKASRPIFGNLVKYGEMWRMGANEATEIEFFKQVKIADKKIPKGRYTLYSIVTETNWIIIINKETDTWGAFKYDEKKDIVRIPVAVQKIDATIESLTMFFEKTDFGCNLIIGWENSRALLPITF